MRSTYTLALTWDKTNVEVIRHQSLDPLERSSTAQNLADPTEPYAWRPAELCREDSAFAAVCCETADPPARLTVKKDKFVVGGKGDRVESRASWSCWIKDDMRGDPPNKLSHAICALQAPVSAALKIEVEQSYTLFDDQARGSTIRSQAGRDRILRHGLTAKENVDNLRLRNGPGFQRRKGVLSAEGFLPVHDAQAARYP